MAKSIRSKRMRKMRAIKRRKNAPKELKRLKKTLGLIIDDDPDLLRYSFADIRNKIKKQKLNQASGVLYHPKSILGAEAEWETIWKVVRHKKNERERMKKGITKEEQEEEKRKEEEEKKKKVTDTMDIDREDLLIDPSTLQNDHGAYPVWMNSRQIKKLQSVRSDGRVMKKGKRKFLW